jgi:hypothetical protein
MSERQPGRVLRASIDVQASTGDVWRVVSAVRRTHEWSPECTRVVPVGEMHPGTWFVGFNRRKRVRWATVSRIVDFDPGSQVAWRVLNNGAVWRYQLEAGESATKIIETREMPRGLSRVARVFARAFLGGGDAHDDELEAGMRRSLSTIKAIVEG